MRRVPFVPVYTASSGVLARSVTRTEAVSPGCAGGAKPVSVAAADQSTRAPAGPVATPPAETSEGRVPPDPSSTCPRGYMAMSMLAPPLLGLNSRACGPSGSSTAGQPKSAVMAMTSPMAPPCSSSRAFFAAGKQRVHIPSMRNTPFASAAAMTRRAPAASRVIGFSTRTCLPALMAFKQSSSCVSASVPMYTTSTFPFWHRSS
mmetsp:Transcript_25439/g.72938  ORF Transcript_25439/g.72938 Transcript_25439/m.72938 type:complete len:204 (+) Transcript_25439:443-1054(+)